MPIQVRLRYKGVRYFLGNVNSKEERVKFTAEILKELENQKRAGNVISSHGIILKHRYVVRDIVYEIIGTESTGNGIFDAIDTVKNTATGKYKEFKRMELFNLTRKK